MDGIPRGQALGHAALARRTDGTGQVWLGRNPQEAWVGSIEPAQDLLVQRHAAQDGGRPIQGFGAQERPDEGSGHATAKTRPHGGLAVAFLLAVNEIALGEYRTAGRDGRRLGDLADQAGIVIGDAKARGLLVEKRACASRAHRVGGVVLEVPLGVELHQGDRAPADIDDVGDIGELGQHHRDLAGREVEPGQLERFAEARRIGSAKPDGVARRDRKVGHGGLQRFGGLAAMPGIE